MDEPKRHVVEDYPADKLPAELRGDIDPTHRARVTVEDTSSAEKDTPARYLRHFGAAKHRNTSIEEAVSRIRALRDEWGE